MSDQKEIDLSFGQDGLYIESEQDPDATNERILLNAPDGALKHAVNVDYQGGTNLKRRKGYHDSWAAPYMLMLRIDAGTPLTHVPRHGNYIQNAGNTARMIVRSSSLVNQTITGEYEYGTFAPADVLTEIDTATPARPVPMLPVAPQVSIVNPAVNYDVDITFDPTPVTGGEFTITTVTWDDTSTLTHGIRGIDRYTYLDNRQTKGTTQLENQRHTLFATRDNANGTYPETHTYFWKNAGDPNIKMLQAPLLDRAVWDSVVANAFSDVNISGMQRARFWNYLTWGLLGETQTFLVGTYGGYYTVPAGPTAPTAWTCGVLGALPPAGTFDSPYINSNCLQRRCLIWYPPWYQDWSAANAATFSAAARAQFEVGFYNWYLPFVWYYKPYDADRNLELTFYFIAVAPSAGTVMTQAVTGASMVVTDVVHSDEITLKLADMTTAPAVGTTISQAGTGPATLVVTSTDLALNTITGTDQHTGFFDNVPANTVSGGALVPANSVVLSVTHTPCTVFGLDMGTGTGWVTDPGHLVTEVGSVPAMSPAAVLLTRIVGMDYDQFYAEPCGAFIEEYHECMFMANIERTVLVGAGYQTPGTPTWAYSPNEIMYSHPGWATANQFGTATTPPQYPFAIPLEPDERPWGCASPDGYRLNRIAYAEPRGVGSIVGMTKWNETLYIMKAQGFTAVTGNHPTNFSFINLGMSQGPVGRFAWIKTDEGIYYVTKNGLFLFRGNPADAVRALSDGKTEKVFKEDIDWPSSTQYITGEILGVSVGWDRTNKQIIISYPKKGEQGGGGEGDLPAGIPTRQMVYDTTQGRFTEWDYKLPITDGYDAPGIGIMASGKEPTDDDYFAVTHPCGNQTGGNDNGRLIFRANSGYLDQSTMGTDGEYETDGLCIPYNATSKDYTLGTLKPKQTLIQQRSVIIANNGNIKRRFTYNFHDVLEEANLTYPAADESRYLQGHDAVNKSVRVLRSSTEHQFSTVAFTFYHDDELPIPLRLSFTGMTATPPVGSVLTQAVTGATLTVTSVNLVSGYVWGTDMQTGTWDTVAGHTVASLPLGIAPITLVPTAVSYQNNPVANNPDMPIQFIAVNAAVSGLDGENK